MGSNVTRWQDHSWQKCIATGLATYLNPIDYIYSLNCCKQNKSLIFTTNVKEQDWAEYLGDPITTQAILDRVFHYSIMVEIDGPSYREHEGKLLQGKYNP